jgi:hypothetical protein
MKDKDLEFLEECNNEQLSMLASHILYDTDGKQRYGEALSSSMEFLGNYPNNLKVLVPNIVDEIQRYGGNTIKNFFRGHGVPYREILENVATKLKVPFNKAHPVEIIEENMLRQLLLVSIDKMEEEDVKQLNANLTKEDLKKQLAFIKAGSPIFIRMTTVIVIQLLAKQGLAQAAGLVAKFAGGRVFAVLAGPVGWILGGLWAAYDVAGPAYRVMIPCTITIAYLRMVYRKNDEELAAILG